MKKLTKFEEVYKKIINECKTINPTKRLIKESENNQDFEDQEYDGQDEDIEDKLYDIGFDTAQPVEYIMLDLLKEAENDPQTVYNKIVEGVRNDGYIEQNDKGENIITITNFADSLYIYFPVEVIKDPQFKKDYQLFQNWWNDIGYDGWSGYGDRGGTINDGEIIDKIFALFNDLGDGSEEKPKICYDDEQLDDDYDESEDEE